MILYTENPKECTIKLLKLINKFSKLQKINCFYIPVMARKLKSILFTVISVCGFSTPSNSQILCRQQLVSCNFIFDTHYPE